MENTTQANDFNLRNMISAVFRQKIFIIILSPPIIVAIFISLLFQTPVYEASVKMHIVGRAAISSETYFGIGSRDVHRTQMEIVSSNSVLERAVKAIKLDKRPLDYEKKFCHPLKYFLIDYKVNKIKKQLEKLTPEQLNEARIKSAIFSLKVNLSTELIPGTDIFTITVKDYDAHEAKALANVVSRSYVIFDLQQQFAELLQRYGLEHPSVRQLRDNIYSMTGNLSGEQLPELEAYGTASVKIIEQAIANGPIGKPKSQIILIAIIASICISIGFAIFYDMFFDRTFKSPEDTVKFTGLPLLGSIPIRKFSDDKLINSDKFDPSKSEILFSSFFEDLADQLSIYMKVNKIKTILITSAFPKGGASTICANLGLTLAQKMHIKTLLIDANFRNPSLNNIFNVKPGVGLSNILEESKLIEYHAAISNTNNEHLAKDDTKQNLSHGKTKKHYSSEQTKNYGESSYESDLSIKTNEIIDHLDLGLDLLQAGNSSMTPFTLFNDSKVDALFRITKNIYDAIIIDCTNLKQFKDAGILASHTDGIVLVVNDGKEKRQIVMNSVAYIKQKNGKPFGIIINRRRFPIPQIIYKWL